jgi:hypothetical protein
MSLPFGNEHHLHSYGISAGVQKCIDVINTVPETEFSRRHNSPRFSPLKDFYFRIIISEEDILDPFFVFVFVLIHRLPDRIDIHYGNAAQINRYFTDFTASFIQVAQRRMLTSGKESPPSLKSIVHPQRLEQGLIFNRNISFPIVAF